MTTAQVDSIAQGRVWTGTDALKLGLVDKIGGLEDAIKHAAILGKTKSYKIENFPEYEKSLQDLLNSSTGFSMFQTKDALLREYIGEESYLLIQQIKKANQLKGVQALMPFELKIQ